MTRALLGDAGAPTALALLGLVVVGNALVAGQALARAAVVPGARGAAAVLVAFLPATLALALPVALLAGATAAGRAWREGGDWIALAGAGLPARHLVLPLLAAGTLAGLLEASLTHLAEPLGRARVREVMVAAAGELKLRPGQPEQLGPVLVHAREVQGLRYADVFVATDDVLAAASEATVEPGGVLRLLRGSARSIPSPGAGDDDGWTVHFAEARLALPLPARRVELAERSTPALVDLVRRMRAEGKSAAAERLGLLKRSTLPASLPLLALLGLPLGARGVRPAAAAVAALLGWWALMRVCDQLVHQLGPVAAGSAPTLALALVTALAWLTWSDR